MILYEGTAVLVTGAASGIGKALAQALAARGARVILADVDAVGVRAAAAELGAQGHALVCDLADAAAAGRLIEEALAVHGRLDLVCSNAGVGHNRRLMKQALDDSVERLFAVNLFAGLRLAQAYVRVLESSGARGRLMFTGSENSLSVPAAVKGAGLGLYAATKHGLLIMAEWLRDELAAAPLDLHVLLPGAVYTPLVARALPDPAKAPPSLGLISSERCAELALRGMDRGLFYIPTHAHLADDMRARSEGIVAALKALELSR
ncbi:MAG: SDR family oxidoreductase [Alphaproteobacteria bacterium]|nr:SDR family oxidoreductase [Alphaproteobacteria bacterium]